MSYRLKVNERLGEWSRYSIYVPELYLEITKAIEKYGLENVSLDIEEYGYPYDSGTYTRLVLIGARNETDDEVAAREASYKERDERQQREKQELFEKLKKELGK